MTYSHYLQFDLKIRFIRTSPKNIAVNIYLKFHDTYDFSEKLFAANYFSPYINYVISAFLIRSMQYIFFVVGVPIIILFFSSTLAYPPTSEGNCLGYYLDAEELCILSTRRFPSNIYL